jgi:hypothetical protein
MKSLHRIATLSLLLSVSAGTAVAADAPSEANQKPHRGPPPEAFAACSSLSSGATCSFTSPRGSVTGTCFAPEGKPLACRPKDGPPHDGSQPSGHSPPPRE